MFSAEFINVKIPPNFTSTVFYATQKTMAPMTFRPTAFIALSASRNINRVFRLRLASPSPADDQKSIDLNTIPIVSLEKKVEHNLNNESELFYILRGFHSRTLINDED